MLTYLGMNDRDHYVAQAMQDAAVLKCRQEAEKHPSGSKERLALFVASVLIGNISHSDIIP